MLIQEKINKIKEDFSYFDNWEEKYQYLIDLGKKLPDLEEKFKIEKFRIQGCTSNLWVVPEFKDNQISLKGASDSVIVQGLFYLIYFVYSEETPSEILDNPMDFFDEIGLSSHLGPSRSNGLNSLKKQIITIATQLSQN